MVSEPSPFRVPDLQPLLAPRSIAVVGASDRPGAGSIVLDNLRMLGYPGSVYPVNPKYTELAGWRCYGSLEDVPGPVDSAAILLSNRQVLTALRQAASIGVRSAWVLASGFAEAGVEGSALQDEVSAFARDHGIVLCGPNCVGVVNLHARAATYSTALPSTLRPGRVGAVLQSGAVCLGIANSNRGIGFSTLISSGNEAGLDNADYIAYLVDDVDTQVIIAFIEGFRRPDRFLWAADRARAAGKPSSSSRSGVRRWRGGLSPLTRGAWRGPTPSTRPCCRTRRRPARLLDELLEAAELFLKAPLPRGRGVGMLTLSGGQIGLIGDVLGHEDLNARVREAMREALVEVLPPYSAISNPLDAWGAGNFEETIPACMAIVDPTTGGRSGRRVTGHPARDRRPRSLAVRPSSWMRPHAWPGSGSPSSSSATSQPAGSRVQRASGSPGPATPSGHTGVPAPPSRLSSRYAATCDGSRRASRQSDHGRDPVADPRRIGAQPTWPSNCARSGCLSA